MKETKLKKCPFCNGDAGPIGEGFPGESMKTVIGHVCGLFTAAHKKIEDAEKEWNQRCDDVEKIFGDTGVRIRAAWKRRAK